MPIGPIELDSLQAIEPPAETSHRLLFARDFGWLWWGQLVSQVGDGITRLALLWYVYTVTGSALQTTVVGLLQTLPPVIFGPLIGVYLDRLPKKSIMIASDLLRAVIIGASPSRAECGHTRRVPAKAAVYARYFDTQSKQLGDDFRTFIFQHQPEINPQNLQQFLDQFAREHKTDLPFAVDPQGKLAAAIQADKDLGTRVGLNHTPTIYVVTNKASGAPYEEVTDRTQLFSTIDRMKVE